MISPFRPAGARLLSCLCLLVAFATTALAQNLILNASFEAPSHPDGNHYDGMVPTNWSAVSGSGSIITNNFNSLWLNATNGNTLYYVGLSSQAASISQSGIVLTAGTSYDLTFDLSTLQNSSPAELMVTFVGGAQSINQTFDLSGGTNHWVGQSWRFTATENASYTLTLASPSGYATNIDNFSLIAVPEPSTVGACMGLAALGLVIRARRRVR